MTETAQQTVKEGQKPKTFAAKAFANDAYQRLTKGDVKYRFVIDMASLK